MITAEQIFWRWCRNAGTDDHVQRLGGNGLHVRDGVLMYGRPGGHRSTQYGPVEIARWIGNRRTGTLLMNAEAFNDQPATRWQNNIRAFATRGLGRRTRNTRWMRNPETGEWGWRTPNHGPRVLRDFEAVPRLPGENRALLVPFAALTAANINLETIKPIQVLDDEFIQRTWIYWLPEWVTDRRELLRRQTRMRETGSSEVYEGTVTGTRELNTGEGVEQVTVRFQSTFRRPAFDSTDWGHSQLRLWFTPQFGVPAWASVIGNGVSGWRLVERVHRMGASLFYGTANGRRSRWISAFDQNEPTPLYYLAMLPPTSRATTVEQAILDLAPPIVHKAWKEGRHVERQGDIFAIETKLTTRQVYRNAITRVRREIVLQQLRPGQPLLHPGPREVKERSECPHCGERTWTGVGPRARAALMIHNTGHTATEVVVKKKGVTYIRGTMHHDPQLDAPGRTRDHIDRQLREGVWYLVVRNTVPRQRNQRQRAARSRNRTQRTEQVRQAA